jgi:hypothetical protein
MNKTAQDRTRCGICLLNITRALAVAGSLAWIACGSAQPVYLDLKTRFDTDAFLPSGGTALTPPLEQGRDRIDATTLPTSYSDNVAFTTADGKASFLFAPLKASSLDALAVNGQTLTVPAGTYAALDLALLSAPDTYADPFSTILFRYADGSVSEQRFGPVPEWFASPYAFDHSFYSYTDSSSVNNILRFNTDWSDNELQYLIDSRGNGNAGGVRFVDGNGFALYLLSLPADVTQATLGVTVGNNFVISLAGQYADPWVSTTEGFTVVANSMEIYGTDHHALGNLKLYEFPLQSFLTNGTGEIYVLFTDASPNDGWGPYIQNLSVYTGTNRFFNEHFVPALNTNNATVYAEFLTDGGAAEAPYLYENKASGPSNRRHRFADGGQNLTYKFDFPDHVTNAKLTIDMANNFVVGISGPLSINRYAQVSPGAPNENDFLIDAGNSAQAGNYRFADGSAYMIYQFDLPNDVTNAYAQVTVGNQFVIEIASGTEGEFVKERDYVAETGNEIRDNANLGVQELNLASYLVNNPEKIIRIRLSDGLPSDGWGPFLTGIAIVDQPGTGAEVWKTVLNSMDLFGVDVHNEMNKGYYTVDLSPVLNANNPNRIVHVNFTDGSTGDGWGPGVFWMAAYSGTLDIQSDGPVFHGLKAMNGEPEGFDVNVLRRQYRLNSSKSLQEIVLPPVPATAGSKPYLLAATLIPAAPPAEVRLTATRAAQGQLLLSWPATAADYKLESTTNLSGQWTAVSGTPQTSGDQLTLTVSTTETASFYRLKK